MNISDDFNRSDSTSIGASWTEDPGSGGTGDWTISGNALTNTSTSGNDLEARYTGVSMASNDQWAEVLTSGAGSSRGIGAFVRHPASTTRTYYCAHIYNAASRELTKRINGTVTALAAPVSGAQTLPGTIRVEAEGSTIRGKWNGTVFATATDTSIPSGPQVGIFGFDLGSILKADSFAASDFVVSTPKALVSVFTPSGALKRGVLKTMAVAFIPTGALTRGGLGKLLASSVAPSTALGRLRRLAKSLTSTVSLTSALSRATRLRQYGRSGTANVSVEPSVEALVDFQPVLKG